MVMLVCKKMQRLMGTAMLLLVFHAPVLAADAEFALPSMEQDEHVAEWWFYQLLVALDYGSDQKALSIWEGRLDQHENVSSRTGESRAWQLAKLYTSIEKYDLAIGLYQQYYAGYFPATVDERARLGERLIFGSIGGSKTPGAIGKAQCPLCHSFQGGVAGERAPSLFGVYRRSLERLQDPRYHLGSPQERDAKKQEACIGCGTATSAMEYLAESVACPNCYIVAGYGFKGTRDTDGGCPIIHKPPINLSIPELIAVETWILKQEGVELSLDEMRNAHEKFIPRNERPGIEEGLRLAALYETKGDYAKALALIEDNYRGVDKYKRQALMRLRDNVDLFVVFKQRDDLIERYPFLLHPNRQPMRHQDTSRLGIEYESFHTYRSEAPRWSPNGNTLLFTTCQEKECQLRLLEMDNRKEKVLVDNAAYGDWSPDGKYVVYISSGNLVRRELLTGEAVVLGEVPLRTNQRPRWSADGMAIEFLQRVATTQPCRKITFNLSEGVWKIIRMTEEPAALSNQSIQDLPYDVIARNEASLFCGRSTQKPSSSPLRRYIVRGQADEVFSMKSRFPSRSQWVKEPVWFLNKEDDFAVLLLRNGRNVTVSPDGHWVAYEYYGTYRGDDFTFEITNLHVARLKEFPRGVHEYALKKGSRDGLRKGMILNVYRDDEWKGYPPIGSVQVVQVLRHESTVKTVVEVHHVQESDAPNQLFEKPVEAGDRVIIPGTKQEAVLLGIDAFSPQPHDESQ